MNAILGMSHLLVEDTYEARNRNRLETTGQAGRHLLSVIDDILDLSRIDAGNG